MTTDDFIDLLPLGEDALSRLLSESAALKKRLRTHGADQKLLGRTAALYFEKPSLRTRVTFEIAMNQTGGSALMLDAGSIGLGRRESLSDVARNLERWIDVLVCRTFSHELVEELARHAQIPVINALTDRSHPCQALAFGLTALERKGTLEGLRLVFLGDGNNVARSLAELAALSGMDFVLCCPEGFLLPPEALTELEPVFARRGRRLEVVHSPTDAVPGADFLYTDVWISMGQERMAEEKTRHFEAFRIDSDLVARAGSDVLVSHCLPAHRGEEITSEVLDGPRSLCFDEAENRLHVQKAVLLELLGHGGLT